MPRSAATTEEPAGVERVTARRGIQNVGGMFTPYYLFEVMAGGRHRDDRRARAGGPLPAGA